MDNDVKEAVISTYLAAEYNPERGQQGEVGCPYHAELIAHDNTGYGISFVLQDKSTTTSDNRFNMAPEHEYIAGFRLSFFPGNENVVISHDAMVTDRKRGQHIGSFLHSVRLRAMRKAGAKLMIATVSESNTPEIAILIKNDWRKVARFEGGGRGWTGLWIRNL